MTELTAALNKGEIKGNVYVVYLKHMICHCKLMERKSNEAIETCTEVLKLEEDYFPALYDRAEAYLLEKRYDEAIKDLQAGKTAIRYLRRVYEELGITQKSLNPEKQFMISKMHYRLGEPDKSLEEVRQCLKLDPRHIKGSQKLVLRY